MELICNHSVPNGIYRLMNSLEDALPDRNDQQMPRAGCPKKVEELFQSYLIDLEEVFDIAVSAWNAKVNERLEDGSTLDSAIDDLIEETGVAGPANCPQVAWVVRKYWLLCETIKGEFPLKPEHFLLGWLIEAGQDDNVKLITAMPYWPIGLDENGNWC